MVLLNILARERVGEQTWSKVRAETSLRWIREGQEGCGKEGGGTRGGCAGLVDQKTKKERGGGRRQRRMRDQGLRWARRGGMIPTNHAA